MNSKSCKIFQRLRNGVGQEAPDVALVPSSNNRFTDYLSSARRNDQNKKEYGLPHLSSYHIEDEKKSNDIMEVENTLDRDLSY